MAIADNRETTYSTEHKSRLFRDIMHELRKSLRGKAHTINEIRRELNTFLRNDTKLIEIFKKHHDYLKESLVVCLDANAKDTEKQEHLDRLLQLFEMHAKAEEQTLYKLLIASSERWPRIEGNLVQDEHDLIYQVMDEMRDMHYMALWSEDVEAKSLMLCELIARHLQKEEAEVFPLAKDDINSGQLNDLSSDYLALCENYLGMSEIRAKGIFL